VRAEAPAFMKDFPKQTYHQLKSQGVIVGKSDASWRGENGKLNFIERSTMKLTLFQKAQEISTLVDVQTSNSLEIQRFAFSMRTNEAELKVSADRVGNVFRLRITQAGTTQTKDLPIQEPVLLSPTIRPYLLMKGLQPKRATYTAFLLEPSALTSIPLSLITQPKGNNQWQVEVKYLSQTLTSLMSGNGGLIKETSDLAGMPIEATPVTAEQYNQLLLSATQKDLVEVAKVSFPHLKDAKNLKSFAVKISGIETNQFELTRHRQKFDGRVLEVKVESFPPKQTLPVQALAGQKNLDRYLEGDASIPVHDIAIQKKAKEIVGAENDLWQRAKKIHEFVYKGVDKTPTVSVPNALEVLKTMRGDCNEHAVLYTALARAAGIPTRIVVGLVYGDRYSGESGFYYHAWVEVFTGKEWIAIDPTWNQMPADATHLAFVEGGLDQQVLVTSLMGRIQLSPVTAATKLPTR